ncbi:hypothetical protein NSZ01_12380 [Nocardioides szechwanensis]|uniref:Secreted protein n=1 Tax=Nocardioides szechwanensis TaxID=1005944 RepID=A0A1H0CCD5_9ACTN|nr:hypothetical protein [Nocardioides szechwanensis]GEP33470.1 hypothetical protein NSZ01_12380 [Nocardioides szechwanensis]SDN55574.1 hypothetical protein SAMN05192576_2384 [Nocardioides szechwanensis]
MRAHALARTTALLPSLVTITALAALLGACGDDDEGDDGSSGSGGLPDGVYPCAYNSGGQLYTLGELVIDGEEYGGFSGGLRGDYSLAGEEALAFSDSFSGLPDGFSVLSAAWLTSTSSGERFVSINIVSEASNNVLTVTCSPE